MSTKKCPYYLVNNEEEFEKATAALGGIDAGKAPDPLHPFPMIVGKESGFGIFQAAGKDHPIPPFEDLVYELQTL